MVAGRGADKPCRDKQAIRAEDASAASVRGESSAVSGTCGVINQDFIGASLGRNMFVKRVFTTSVAKGLKLWLWSST